MSSKEIKARIKSVSNTRKITKAMELIYTVKMKKAQEAVRGIRPFSLAALEILAAARYNEEAFAQYSATPDVEKELIVLVASEKGLCGSYNATLYKKIVEYVEEDNDDPYTGYYEYVTIGKHARDFVLRTGQTLVADFSEEVKDPFTDESSHRLTTFLLSEWKTGKYSKITFIYNHYISVIAYQPVARTFLPILPDEIDAFFTDIDHTPTHFTDSHEHTIEPNIQTIVDITIPMILNFMLREMISEARVSEYSARMIAMKNASDAAHKKVEALRLVYNKTRQAGITTEISEIVSGVESMKDIS